MLLKTRLTKRKEKTMKKLWNWIVERSKEKSTRATLATVIAGVAGSVIAPEQADNISAAMLAIVIAIASFTKEEKK